MVQYRRNRIAGSIYFFTITLKDRQSDFLIQYIDDLKNSYRKVKSKKPFITKAFVILPEHLHVIWQLPEQDGDYPGRWREIKKSFTQALLKKSVNLSKNKHGEYDLWQRRYWEHTIKSDEDMENHINYIHYNPVKHGLVKRARDWPYSSFHDYVKKEILEIDWGCETSVGGDLTLLGE